MEDYKPNSQAYRHKQLMGNTENNKKEIKSEKVINGAVTIRKKPFVTKLINDIFSFDRNTIADDLFNDVLIPYGKKAITDAVDILLNQPRGHSKKNSNVIYGGAPWDTDIIDYGKISKKNKRKNDQDRARINLDDIFFENRGDAEIVLDKLLFNANYYGLVTVNDLYDAIGENCPWTAEKYGWAGDLTKSPLARATVVRRYGGYVLDLPRPMPIE